MSGRPTVPRESVRVRLRGNTLEVSGRRVPPIEPSGHHYHRAEIYFGSFRRVVELPWQNPDGRGVAELTALPGARVAGEHLHHSVHEHFSVLSGELTVMRDGRRSTLRAGEGAHIEPGVWHDWWNEAREDAVVRVELTPGERFVHMR